MSNTQDPRVLFASERTLLAWNRTSISLMAFGFVVERFGLFLQLIGKDHIEGFQRDFSFYVGVSFVLLAACMAIYSILQHCKLVKSLQPSDIPCGYNIWAGMVVNGIVGLLGLALSVYLIHGFI